MAFFWPFRFDGGGLKGREKAYERERGGFEAGIRNEGEKDLRVWKARKIDFSSVTRFMKDDSPSLFNARENNPVPLFTCAVISFLLLPSLQVKTHKGLAVELDCESSVDKEE
ncbi:hypothetical protein AAC387_Pa04g1919 [Persea americana]